MAELILLIIICSLWCFGFNYAVLYTPNFDMMSNNKKEIYPTDNKKEVLWFIRYYGNKWLPLWVTKPIYGCLSCMGSVHGIIFYWSYVLLSPGRITPLNFILCVVVITAVTGLNRILRQLAQL